MRELLREVVQRTAPVQPDMHGGIDFRKAVADHERELITTALRIAGGRQKEAARLLHIAPSTLHCKIKTLGIDLGEFN